LAPSAAAWEVLGDAWAGDGDVARAQRSYHSAFALGRGETVAAPSAANPHPLYPDTHPTAVEERDQHGVPRLPE
jgi:HemY protein